MIYVTEARLRDDNQGTWMMDLNELDNMHSNIWNLFSDTTFNLFRKGEDATRILGDLAENHFVSKYNDT